MCGRLVRVCHIAHPVTGFLSGKIMRRILRKIAEGEADKLGDTSTLADPSIVAVSQSTRKY